MNIIGIYIIYTEGTMKKTLIVISFFVIAACFEGTSSKAYTSLPYWYTDATTLSKFESVNVTYQKQRYSGCNMTLSKLRSEERRVGKECRL